MTRFFNRPNHSWVDDLSEEEQNCAWCVERATAYDRAMNKEFLTQRADTYKDMAFSRLEGLKLLVREAHNHRVTDPDEAVRYADLPRKRRIGLVEILPLHPNYLRVRPEWIKVDYAAQTAVLTTLESREK